MALEIEKKKNESEASVEKSKGLNIFLWLLTVAIIAASAFGNIYFQDQYCCGYRVVVDLFKGCSDNQSRQKSSWFLSRCPY